MKRWLKISLIILSIITISVGIYFLLKYLGITDIKKLREIIANCGAWGWIVFITLFILSSTLLCFIPGSSATFIAVSILLFGAIKGFIISTISVFVASSIMFIIGNTLGEKVAIKLVGKESLEKAQNLIDVKSKMFLPLMFLFPIFPDDALCLVAGMTKMKYWYFALIVAIFRTIGIATICFLGSGLINWGALSLVDWFVLVNVIAFDIVLIFKYQSKIENFIMRRKRKEEVPNEEAIAQEIESEHTDKLDRMLLQRTAYQKAIEKRQEIIKNKRYGTEKQLHNIQKKIKNTGRALALLERNIAKESNKVGVTLTSKNNEEPLTNSNKELQDIVCEEINKAMNQYFPKIEYSITRSLSSPSVYLRLKNNNGVEKTIRFSNHDSKKNLTRHTMEETISTKAFKKIIEKNIKILNKKTVYVLLDKVSKEREMSKSKGDDEK